MTVPAIHRDADALVVEPWDQHNRALVEHVHPPGSKTPCVFLRRCSRDRAAARPCASIEARRLGR
jgi:hypothetical protein